MNHNSKHSHSRIRRTVAAVLIVAALVVFVGVFLVFQCLSFDENGAHVIDRYGILAEKNSCGKRKRQRTASQDIEKDVRQSSARRHAVSNRFVER